MIEVGKTVDLFEDRNCKTEDAIAFNTLLPHEGTVEDITASARELRYCAQYIW